MKSWINNCPIKAVEFHIVFIILDIRLDLIYRKGDFYN